MFRSKAERKVLEAWVRPCSPAAWPVPDREMARPPRRGVPHIDLATWDFKVSGESSMDRALDGGVQRAADAEVTQDITA